MKYSGIHSRAPVSRNSHENLGVKSNQDVGACSFDGSYNGSGSGL